ncbi:MAG: hypothetical protein Q9171_006603 [Xanthocarpia ochracea]
MSSQAPNASSALSPAIHGGDMDPNEVRLRQGRAQHTAATSPDLANNPSVPPTVASPHGGDMDPNEVRLRQARMQQTPGHWSPQSLQSPQSEQYFPNPNGNQPVQPHAFQRSSAQSSHTGLPAQAIGGSHPMASLSPQQDPQSPPSAPPNQYLPTSSNYLPTYAYQGSPQQSSYNYQPGLPPQGTGNYPMSSNPAASPPGAPYAPVTAYGPSQASPVNNQARCDLGAVEAHVTFGAPAERGGANVLTSEGKWRWKWPNFYRLPPIPRPGNDHHHRDMMQRAKTYPSEDYYLSPYDGHLAKLFVQCTQSVYDANSNCTWRRTYIRDQSPWTLQVANWATDNREGKGEDLAMMGLKWIPSCVAILLLMLYPIQDSGEVRNNGKYDPFPYKFWGYPYHARNAQERKLEMKGRPSGLAQPSTALQTDFLQGTTSALNPVLERPVEPKYLCFLKKSEGVEKRNVSEWKD